MWYLIACFTDVDATGCTTPQAMPSREVCQTVGSAFYKTMIGGRRHVTCVNGDTGETVAITGK